MTGGGLMQLVAYGAQDVYLSGNPQITFFKQLYKRHTNFSIQSVEATFNGTVGFGKRASLVVPRVGDLMYKVYLHAILPEIIPLPVDGETPAIAWEEEVGHFLIKSIEVQIGGQIIDKHYGIWLCIWNNLTIPAGKADGYSDMIGGTLALPTRDRHPKREIYVPLQFWFCRAEGMALPLIALQYHEVRFVLEFEEIANLISNSEEVSATETPILDDASLYIDYVFLDTQERRKFASLKHEYLIDQVQFTGDSTLFGTTTNVKLSFNHPVKELVWITLSDDRKQKRFSISNPAINPVKSAKLQFNGHDRFTERTGRYFNEVQPYQHHTNIPEEEGINVYSFALYPEQDQPSGTSNFSRIDNATLSITLTDEALEESGNYAKIFAVNYNVLRCMSGMGGLAYSN